MWYLFDNKGDKRIRNFISRYFNWLVIIFIYTQLWFNLTVRKRSLYLVVSNGKAASTSVLNSLKRKGLYTWQMHNVDYQLIKANLDSIKRTPKKAYPLHLLFEYVFLKYFYNRFAANYIVLYRNDRRQNLSSIFQNSDIYGGKLNDLEFVSKEMQIISQLNVAWKLNIENFCIDKHALILDWDNFYSWEEKISVFVSEDIHIENFNNASEKYYALKYEEYLKSFGIK